MSSWHEFVVLSVELKVELLINLWRPPPARIIVSGYDIRYLQTRSHINDVPFLLFQYNYNVFPQSINWVVVSLRNFGVTVEREYGGRLIISWIIAHEFDHARFDRAYEWGIIYYPYLTFHDWSFGFSILQARLISRKISSNVSWSRDLAVVTSRDHDLVWDKISFEMISQQKSFARDFSRDDISRVISHAIRHKGVISFEMIL